MSRQRGTHETNGTLGGGNSPQGAHIVVDGLQHRFLNRYTGQSIEAVKHVDLEIQPGEFVTVVGPSGCGKSTLLKAIAGLIKPSGGRITCNGEVVKGPGKERGVVFQDLAILPWRTVKRNVAHGLEIQGVPRAEREERVSYLIDLMGLRGFENHYPHQLSGGMKQRVAVARTWAPAPAAILMDEPFAAVDAQTRITLQEELLRISTTSNCSLMFITHNVDEAVFLGDRVVVMSQRPGTIKEIVDVTIPRSERSVATMGDAEFMAQTESVLRLVREEV